MSRKRCSVGKWLVNGECVTKNSFPVLHIPITNIKKIKKFKKSDAILISRNVPYSKEGIIYPRKYGDNWWKKAKREDIERVAVW